MKKDTKYEEKEGLEEKHEDSEGEGQDKPKHPKDTIRMRITTEVLTGKESEEYKAAIIGDEVGDPMKATSGPAISVLMKQTSLIALIFGEFFASVALIKVSA